MKTLKWVVISMTILSLGFILAGCGGGGSNLVNMQGRDTIASSDREADDGSYGDIHRFRATRTGTVELTMCQTGTHPVTQPYVVVWEGDEDSPTQDTLVGFSTGTTDDPDIYTSFHAHEDVEYTVLFTTADAADFGSYSWSIEEVDPYSDLAAKAKPITTQSIKSIQLLQKR